MPLRQAAGSHAPNSLLTLVREDTHRRIRVSNIHHRFHTLLDLSHDQVAVLSVSLLSVSKSNCNE